MESDMEQSQRGIIVMTCAEVFYVDDPQQYYQGVAKVLPVAVAAGLLELVVWMLIF